jgi:FkbM family methyltransferase
VNQTIATLPVVDGVRVNVPNRIQQITAYVLAEQQDWFEDEIKFVRCCLRPGQRAIDVGASFGVYTLAIAKVVGPTGKVWAFEPYPPVAELLLQSVQLNHFPEVVVDRRAVTRAVETVPLALHRHAEGISIAREGSPTAQGSLLVEATTLDACRQQYGWHQIDFIKLDAEGEELAILEGASSLLRVDSPLIQYEIKSGLSQSYEIPHRLQDLQYSPYRLVPGLNALVPVDLQQSLDPSVVNLFSCKVDRARALADAGRLVQAEELSVERFRQASQVAKTTDRYDFRSWLTKFPYGERLAKDWKRTSNHGQREAVSTALALYAMSRDPQCSIASRYLALIQASRLLAPLCEVQAPEFARCATFARILLDLGCRALAFKTLAKLLQTYEKNRRLDLAEPFLPPLASYDHLPPRDALGTWLIAAVTEAMETSIYSSFYGRSQSIHRLESLRDLGYASPTMLRRLAMVKQLVSEQGEQV